MDESKNEKFIEKEPNSKNSTINYIGEKPQFNFFRRNSDLPSGGKSYNGDTNNSFLLNHKKKTCSSFNKSENTVLIPNNSNEELKNNKNDKLNRRENESTSSDSINSKQYIIIF